MTTNPFNFIKDNVSILDVVSSYTSLKRAGMYWKGSCPFHSEKTGSFTVSPHKGIFYCFGCHEGGDVITFIAKAENSSPIEAVTFLADRFGIELPKNIEFPKNTSEETDRKKRYWKTCELVTEWCHQELLKDKTTLAYLYKRSFDDTIIKTYKLGYFAGGSKKIAALIAFVQKHNILAQDLLDAYILGQGKAVLYSPFEERIIFPITDHLGRYCAFGGRIFKPNDERPKYYNSKETDYFNKGSTLFGFEHAKKAIQEQESVLLVEGYTDCLAMVQHGFKNTVATLGTACTLDHLKILSRYAHVVYVLFDGDTAGKNAMLRLTELCWQVDLDVRILRLPPEHDPASYLESGSKIQDLIKQSEDIFVFFVQVLGKDFMQKPLTLKLRLTRKILETLQNIAEPLKQDLLIHAAAKTFGVPFQILKDELGRLRQKPTLASSKPQTAQTPDLTATLKDITTLEKKLFSVIINSMKLVAREDVILLIDYFTPLLKNILKRVQDLVLNRSSCTFNELYTTLSESEQLLVSYLLIEFQESEEAEIEQLILQFQKQHWKSLVISFQHKLRRAEEHRDEVTTKRLISEFQSLKKRLVTRGT